MLRVQQQKHLAYYDDNHSYFASYQLQLTRSPQRQDKNKDNDIIIKDTTIKPQLLQLQKFIIDVKVRYSFTFQWQSDYYTLGLVERPCHYGQCPFSLQNYLQIYKNPKIHRFELILKPTYVQSQQTLLDSIIGKLIIKTNFKGNCFKLPVSIIENNLLNIEAQKYVSVISPNDNSQMVICSGQLIETKLFSQVNNFQIQQPCKDGYRLNVFTVEDRVSSQEIVIVRGAFQTKQFVFDKVTIRICSFEEDIFYMSGLMQALQQVKSIMSQLDSITIIQNLQTCLQDGHRIVFYSDLSTLYPRIYRSLLYDKISDSWLIEGMVYYNRSNKHFQDVMRELIDLISDGQELVPLHDSTFQFDQVWKLKAIFFYHILSNFKIMRDYGSSSLATLIIEQARKTKVTSQVLFRKLKNKYGLKNFRTIYEKQFVLSTGLNRIFYEIIDVKRQNKVKIIVRQKSLANKVFRLYNMFRIKLQQQYGIISPLIQRIINKNKLERKKQLSGPLAVPKIINCLPYFIGQVAVETDASQMAFQLKLREENIIEEKQNVTSKIRAPIRKSNENDKSYEGYGWMMIDTAHIFPAVYKNQNVHESVILQKIKRRYDSEHEEIKVLNCISSRDHSQNQKICRALIEKVKINSNIKENCTISVKRKILQILPVFLSKATDFTLWEDILSLLKLYEPICHDYSEQGYFFLLSIVESVGEIDYKKQFSYYFQQFHRILLIILRQLNGRSEQRQQKLKMAIYSALTKWSSRYSLQILGQILIQLKLSRCKVRAHLEILKVLFKNIYGYLKNLQFTKSCHIINQIDDLMKEIVDRDTTFQLFAIKLSYELQEKDKELSKPLAFLKHCFKLIQGYREENIRKYSIALQCLKKILSKNKKIYGLQLQLTATQNQNYFIAEYLWCELTSQLSCQNQMVRLQWIKIYRIFYFYFIPIITLRKIRNNCVSKEYRLMNEEAAEDILNNLKDFQPDIKWFSGYDSRSAKELKAKYEQMNQSKRKRRFDQYNFSENNVITIFIKQHPGRETWDQLARQAIRIFISIYEDKEQKSDGKEAERYKSVQEGFKKIQQKLKRGRMPDHYNYQQLKEEIGLLMNDYGEEEKKIADILLMVDRALLQISQQKSKRQAQLRDEMRIIITLQSIHQEQEDQNVREEQPQANEGGDDQLLFGEEDPQEGKDIGEEEEPQNNADADDDMEIFAE